MTDTQVFITILIIATATLVTRAVPFLLFPPGKKTPKYILYLGYVLPCATIGLLVVYCLKTVTLLEWPHGIPEVIAIAVVALIQFWKKNTLISIVAGTGLYMLLVQFVFV